MNRSERESLIAVARGDQLADVVLRGGKILNVFTGETTAADIAICEGMIAGIGGYDGETVIDLGGQFVLPGFVDAHVHIESAMVTPPEYARAVVPRGTSAVVADPHEIANVLGVPGVEFMLRTSRNLPLDVHIMASPCVPATHMETSGAVLSPQDVQRLLKTDGVLGLAEVMNFPGVIDGAPDMMAKLQIAEGRVRDGHAPGVTGRALQAYLAAGIGSDHECTTADEALEKVRAGAYVMIREGTAAKNLEALAVAVSAENHHRFLFCTDDRHPADLLEEGHIDFLVCRAIQLGIKPLHAIRMATINAAQYFGLERMGAVSPGRFADLITCDSLDAPQIHQVFRRGTLVAENGKLLVDLPRPDSSALPSDFAVPALNADLFSVPAKAGKIRVIEACDGQIITGTQRLEPTLADACAIADSARDLAKLAVIERHHGSEAVGLGFVTGLRLAEGALASSVAHDSHNLVVAGMNDQDMALAAERVAALGGGLVAVRDGEVLAELALPIAGLMSDLPLPVVRDQVAHLKAVSRELGSTTADPYMLLSFLALPVIPELKLTDQGLVDVDAFEIVPLFSS